VPEVHRREKSCCWQATGRREQPARIDEDAVMVGDEVEMSEVRPDEKPAKRGGSKSMKT
jgi:hypothetical protein